MEIIYGNIVVIIKKFSTLYFLNINVIITLVHH